MNLFSFDDCFLATLFIILAVSFAFSFIMFSFLMQVSSNHCLETVLSALMVVPFGSNPFPCNLKAIRQTVDLDAHNCAWNQSSCFLWGSTLI